MSGALKREARVRVHMSALLLPWPCLSRCGLSYLYETSRWWRFGVLVGICLSDCKYRRESNDIVGRPECEFLAEVRLELLQWQLC